MQPEANAMIFEIATLHFGAIIATSMAGLAFLVAALWLWQLVQVSRNAALVTCAAILAVVGMAYSADKLGRFSSPFDIPTRFVLWPHQHFCSTYSWVLAQSASSFRRPCLFQP
jgi:hypothetical protein